MNAIGALHTSLVLARPGVRIPDASAFQVPKSPLRADGARHAGRDNKATLATDTVEISHFNPMLAIGAAYQPARLPALPSLGDGDDGDKSPGPGLGDGAVRNGDDEENQGQLAETEGDGGDKDGEDAVAGMGEDKAANGEPLDETERQEVAELERRDQEVRQHEQAHKAVGGSHAGAISYEYQMGPDGRRYAVGGEVSIDVSPEKDAAATAAKMRQVRAAALAPAQPSSQDLAVAAEASKREAEAKQELAQERREEAMGGLKDATGGNEEGEDGSVAGTAEAEDGGAERSGGPAASPVNRGESSASSLRPSPSIGVAPYARLTAAMADRRQPASPDRRALAAFGIDVFA